MDQPPLPQEVRAWLDEVKWSNSLALDNFNLGSIPEEVFSWTHLAELFLTQNQITQVPSSIAKLNKLRYLDLSYNNIESIPLELCQMPSLTRLHITNCNLSSLPDHFSQFPGLKFLSLSGNSFKEIPEPVLKLKSLESLYINYNKITTIPEDIHERLPNLTTLNLSFNSITEIPRTIANLNSLSRLEVKRNQFECIPYNLMHTSDKLYISTDSSVMDDSLLCTGKEKRDLVAAFQLAAPSLQELAAIAFLSNEKNRPRASVPPHLSEIMEGAMECSYCSKPFIRSCVACVVAAKRGRTPALAEMFLCSGRCLHKLRTAIANQSPEVGHIIKIVRLENCTIENGQVVQQVTSV